MDFGRVASSQLYHIDFGLPEDPVWNKQILPGERSESIKIYIGCPRWSVKEWVGTVYPKGTKETNFLEYYAKQFNCIELNATFYNTYSSIAIEKWAAKVGGNEFKFCPKVFQGISHEGTLLQKQLLTNAFIESVAAFGQHLGPSFLQLNESFSPDKKEELAAFISMLPVDFDMYVELRHWAWFQPAALQFILELLQEKNKGILISDVAGRRDVCHMHLAQPRAFVRFVANDGHATDYTRLDDWIQRITDWINRGLKELYFIVHTYNETTAPGLVGYFVDGLNSINHLSLKKPIVQKELFD